MIAKQLNKATGPSAVVLTMGSLTPKDPAPPSLVPQRRRELPPGFSRGLMNALRDALVKDIKPESKVIELDRSFNEPQFAHTVMEIFDEMMAER